MKFLTQFISIALIIAYVAVSCLYIRHDDFGGGFGGRSTLDMWYFMLLIFLGIICLINPFISKLIFIVGLSGLLLYYMYDVTASSYLFNSDLYAIKDESMNLHPAPNKNYITGLISQFLFLLIGVKSFVVSKRDNKTVT